MTQTANPAFARFSQTDPDLELAGRELARRSLIDYTTYTYPAYKPEAFHLKLGETLEACERGDLTRLMIIAPPQHGKSEITSIRFPSWWLGRNPELPVIITSYGSKLAQAHAGQAVEIINSQLWANVFEETVKKYTDPKKPKGWAQKHIAGKITFAGVGGPITGFGGGLGLIDDPIKNLEEAMSPSYREKTWRWYRAVFRPRIWERGVIVIIMTRWHEDDLIGRILNDTQDKWEVLHMPAIALSQEDRDAYYTHYYPGMVGTADPLNRQPGDPLAPGRYSLNALLTLKHDVGSSAWSSEYQGMPRPMEGNRIKAEWLATHFVEDFPREVEVTDINGQTRSFPIRLIRYWDKGGTENDGARTAGVLLGMTRDKRYFVIDVIIGQWSPFRREEVIKATCELDALRWGKPVETWVEQEPGSGGKESALLTIQNLAGYHIRADRPTVSKEIRFESVAVQMEAGNFFLVRGKWNSEYVEELLLFPNGTFKDQVDATSGAFKILTLAGWGRGTQR